MCFVDAILAVRGGEIANSTREQIIKTWNPCCAKISREQSA
jgi:hypothetical protein